MAGTRHIKRPTEDLALARVEAWEKLQSKVKQFAEFDRFEAELLALDRMTGGDIGEIVRLLGGTWSIQTIRLRLYPLVHRIELLASLGFDIDTLLQERLKQQKVGNVITRKE